MPSPSLRYTGLTEETQDVYKQFIVSCLSFNLPFDFVPILVTMADPVTTQIMDSVVQILQQEQQMIGHLILRLRLRLRRDVSPLVFGTTAVVVLPSLLPSCCSWSLQSFGVSLRYPL